MREYYIILGYQFVSFFQHVEPGEYEVVTFLSEASVEYVESVNVRTLRNIFSRYVRHLFAHLHVQNSQRSPAVPGEDLQYRVCAVVAKGKLDL